MPGSVFDLTRSDVLLPQPIVVDTNVVAARLLASYHEREVLNATRTAAFFDDLIATGRSVLFTPTAYGELLHASIRRRYQSELQVHRDIVAARFARRMTSWSELYKRDPSILREHAETLEHLRLRLTHNNVTIVAPEDLGPIASGRPFDEELIRLIGRYGLDTNDALILMEADRLGVRAIITMDRDMERALPDFDVYLWR